MLNPRSYCRFSSQAHESGALSQSHGVVVRFAPSPTGSLHVGSVRTALVNWLFARYHGGTMRLRIEDTDQQRSTPQATQAIIQALAQLDISHDGEIVYQSQRRKIHHNALQNLKQQGLAYACYANPEELQAMRERMQAGETPRAYMDVWRDRYPDAITAQRPFTVRLKIDRSQPYTTVHDTIQGTVNIPTEQIDDFILLRADGTPTYMGAVVVDDRDMDVTHIIRGVDHLHNTARQIHLFQALKATIPTFAHLPLIHGSDGAKLSKRHGAVHVSDYLEKGFLPQALLSHLALLGGWHPDPEPDIIAIQSAARIFDLGQVKPSPARFDLDRLRHRNAMAIRNASPDDLMDQLTSILSPTQQHSEGLERLRRALPFLTLRAHTLPDITQAGQFLLEQPAYTAAACQESLVQTLQSPLFDDIEKSWHALSQGSPQEWGRSAMADFKEKTKLHETKMKAAAQALRWCLTGSTASAGDLSEILEVLGSQESQSRLRNGRQWASKQPQ